MSKARPEKVTPGDDTYLRRSENRKKGGPEKRGFGKNNAATLLLLFLAVVSSVIALDETLNLGQIRSGVSVAGIDVGGLSREEARARLERTSGEDFDVSLRANGEDVVLSEPVNVDLAATVERAYSIGRTGSIPERLSERLLRISGVDSKPVAEFDRGQVERNIAALSASVDRDAQDATVSVNGGRVSVEPSNTGYRLDQSATLSRVERATTSLEPQVEAAGQKIPPKVDTDAAEATASRMEEMSEGGLTLASASETWRLSEKEALASLEARPQNDRLSVNISRDALRTQLDDVYRSVSVDPREAAYTLDNGNISVTPGRSGQSVEEERLLDAAEKALSDTTGDAPVEVPVREVEPELTTEEARRLKPTEVLGEYQTDYTWDTDPGRRYNMEVASQAMTGVAVAPGETFSYNEIASSLDLRDAKVIQNGAVDYAKGGGLSQVSSTLYMAANYADLDIVEGNPHYSELPYIRPGLDTTVWFGALDLRFTNNTDGYIILEQWQGADGYNKARVWGRPTGKQVEISSEKIFEGSDNQGKPMTRWAAYKTVARDGETLYDGIFRRVTYRELDPYDPEE